MPARQFAIDRLPVERGWTPLELPDLGLWFKADGLVGLNDNDPVDPWPDMSGNVRNMVAVSAAVYKENVQNGLPGVLFSSDRYNITWSHAATPLTVCIAMNCDLNAAQYVMDIETGRFILMTNWAGSVGYSDAGNTRNIAATQQGIQYLTWWLEAGVGTGEMFRNGGSIGTDDYVETAIGDEVNFGSRIATGANPFEDHIFEIVICTAKIPVEDLTALHSYIGSKWAMA